MTSTWVALGILVFYVAFWLLPSLPNAMSGRRGNPSAQYRYEHYDPWG